MSISPFFGLFNSVGNFALMLYIYFTFIRSLKELPDNGLSVEMVMYWDWLNSTIQPDPSLIQLSILYKMS